MKKERPITLRKSEIRKSVRKPMPPPARTEPNKRRKKLDRIIRAESRES